MTISGNHLRPFRIEKLTFFTGSLCFVVEVLFTLYRYLYIFNILVYSVCLKCISVKREGISSPFPKSMMPKSIDKTSDSELVWDTTVIKQTQSAWSVHNHLNTVPSHLKGYSLIDD